jgi:hypothetical protein
LDVGYLALAGWALVTLLLLGHILRRLRSDRSMSPGEHIVTVLALVVTGYVICREAFVNRPRLNSALESLDRRATQRPHPSN